MYTCIYIHAHACRHYAVGESSLGQPQLLTDPGREKRLRFQGYRLMGLRF